MKCSARPNKTCSAAWPCFAAALSWRRRQRWPPAVSGDILTVLGGLVDKSLVAVVDGPGGERRFRLLEPVRQFAAELLQASGTSDRRRPPPPRSSAVSFAGSGRHPGPRRAARDWPPRWTTCERCRGVRHPDLRTGGRRRPDSGLLVVVGEPGAGRRATGSVGCAALRAADPALMSLDVLSAALSQASTRATYLGRCRRGGRRSPNSSPVLRDRASGNARRAGLTGRSPWPR